MTNYNDGKWHGWNGGECPVHPETVVQIATGEGTGEDSAKRFKWDGPDHLGNPIIAFRVTGKHPRERWLVDDVIFDNYDAAEYFARDHGFELIHVREVIE